MNKKGFTIIELMIAIVILGIVSVGMVNVSYFMSKQSVKIKEQTYSTQKAMQIMAELRAAFNKLDETQLSAFDNYNNTVSTPTLTIENVPNPASPLSDNTIINGDWKYLRKVSIVTIPDRSLARQVTVRVYKNSSPSPTPLSELVNVFDKTSSSPQSEYQPTQVIDMYVLDIENVDTFGTSRMMSPIFNATIKYLEDMNPGLQIKIHRINRLSYGRDLLYTPRINKEKRTGSEPRYASANDEISPPFVYLYPGLIEAGGNVDFFLYDPNLMCGRIRIDNTIANSGSYSLCDMNNHAVRYPDEVQLYNAAVTQAKANNQTPPEPSLRMLLEQMNSIPTDSNPFKNILLVNLHGGVTPFPPMRNYSDAAKDPQGHPNIRIVTHPEQLQYNAGASVKLRVYPYITNPEIVRQNAEVWSDTSTLATATIFLPNENIPDFRITVEKITGDATTTNYSKSTVTQGVGTYQITHPQADSTLITLYNSPIRHSSSTVNNMGLGSDRRLYGMEYIPCPVEPSGVAPFTYDLTWSSAMPKNTARWVITFDSNALGLGMHTFETRISTDLETGTILNQPTNLSRTYTWVGMSPPVTEQSQFVGDPRHCPYSDVKANGHYNWFFIDTARDWYGHRGSGLGLELESKGFKGFTKTDYLWNKVCDDDILRYCQLYRQGLLNTRGIIIHTNTINWTKYGKGGEFSMNDAWTWYGIWYSNLPWSNTGDTSNVKISPSLGHTYTAASRTDDSWYAKYWLGELYPDSDYTRWVANNGNLPTSPSTTDIGNYYLKEYRAIPDFVSNAGFIDHFASYGNAPRSGRQSWLHYYGANAFVNSVDNNALVFGSDRGDISLTSSFGESINGIFNINLQTTKYGSRFGIDRRCDDSSGYNDYINERTTLFVPNVRGVKRDYYKTLPGSYPLINSILRVTSHSPNSSFYSVFSALVRESDAGTAELSKVIATVALRTFLDMGLYTGTENIAQVPLVDVSTPTVSQIFENPTDINIEWDSQWKRWGNKKYTDDYDDNYSETTPIVYSVKYSADTGATWFYCSDNSPTTIGDKDLTRTIVNTNYNWNVSMLPQGSYMIRVECYRRDLPMHYSYDYTDIYIKR